MSLFFILNYFVEKSGYGNILLKEILEYFLLLIFYVIFYWFLYKSREGCLVWNTGRVD